MDLNADQVINDQFIPAPKDSELMYVFSSRPYDDLYWSLPVFPGKLYKNLFYSLIFWTYIFTYRIFVLGKRVLSYGGTLSLTQKFQTGGVPEQSSPGRDVVLVGEFLTIYWTNPTPIRSDEALVNVIMMY